MKFIYLYLFFVLTVSCGRQATSLQEEEISSTFISTSEDSSLIANNKLPIDRKELVDFAKTLQGIPYKYGSTNPENGFDCSGFITYTFTHFNSPVPRSSVDFTNYGTPVSFKKALPGDLILFTGTDSTKRVVGHMGILTQTTDSIKFIHSTSGKAYGVTITPLNKYYAGRFVKIIRVLD